MCVGPLNKNPGYATGWRAGSFGSVALDAFGFEVGQSF
jgi:hypothetical protein